MVQEEATLRVLSDGKKAWASSEPVHRKTIEKCVAFFSPQSKDSVRTLGQAGTKPSSLLSKASSIVHEDCS